MPRKKSVKQTHYASDFGLDVMSGDDDMFRWFLLAYLFGKPIQSTVAAQTWKLFIDKKLDTPWAISNLSDYQLVSILHEGKYTRYQHVMARALHKCMDQLIRMYDGSLMQMVEFSMTEDDLFKQLQKLYGVGPKTAEIFMRETEDFFAQRLE